MFNVNLYTFLNKIIFPSERRIQEYNGGYNDDERDIQYRAKTFPQAAFEIQ